MNIKALLPAGSVVLLKDGKKRLMIIGVMQNDIDDAEKTYDYMGVLYPEGHLGAGFQFLFNHDDIDEVFFRGFEDAERAEFLEKLSGFYEKQ